MNRYFCVFQRGDYCHSQYIPPDFILILTSDTHAGLFAFITIAALTCQRTSVNYMLHYTEVVGLTGREEHYLPAIILNKIN